MVNQKSRRIAPGADVGTRKLISIYGEPVLVPDPNMLVHLQFRRFAGCPMCHLHLQALRARYAEIEAAGIREVVLFHSSTTSLLAHQSDPPPFAVVGDPEKRLYREFGVEASWRAPLHPGAWRAEVRGLLAKRRKFAFDFNGGPRGLPADFLVAPNGKVLASKYGVHGYDQWSVDEILKLAAEASSAGTDIRSNPG
ncbi:peroxiredoxin-like family protein [Sporichthya sp.]|uniref:peroxiredoxin-like family protein n=1 Tax=Sporichthya sp. TaxID=65475 RepID=UPI001807E3B3|nr:peroxiredoxin-like family protein [Sporichthya sp.]MBA3741624.1 AhpC/TSA family protein [Sporichthya sp.]